MLTLAGWLLACVLAALWLRARYCWRLYKRLSERAIEQRDKAREQLRWVQEAQARGRRGDPRCN